MKTLPAACMKRLGSGAASEWLVQHRVEFLEADTGKIGLRYFHSRLLNQISRDNRRDSRHDSVDDSPATSFDHCFQIAFELTLLLALIILTQ